MSITTIARNTIILLALVSTAAWAQSFDEGVSAYNEGDYEIAYEVFRPLAEGGDAAAQLYLGLMYIHGRGVIKSQAQGLRWYQTAAEQGNAKAQFRLGQLYLWGGGGTPRDVPKAVRWFESAARQGLAVAQFYLGAQYAYGPDEIKDTVTAHMWSNIASANGSQAAETQRSELSSQMGSEAIAAAEHRAYECIESDYQDCD